MADYLAEALEIIEKYIEFTNAVREDYGIVFIYNDIEYKIWIFSDDASDMPVISEVNEIRKYPHISLFDFDIQGNKHRCLCLFEEGIIVKSLISFNEKIKLLLNRLIELSNLSKHEIEEEYQKEFLHYWNVAVKQLEINYQLFLKDDERGQWLNQYLYDDTIRIAETSTMFNDILKAQPIEQIQVLYLPIINARGIIPPLPTNPWGEKQILDIICNLQVQKINSDIYTELSNLSYSKKAVILVFKLNNMHFGCIIKFKNAGTAKFTRKLERDISEVIPIKIQRCDFIYLNKQIGNDLTLIEKKIAIIGAGSLGSYIAEELIRSGCKNIVVIDDDVLEPDNIMRHRLSIIYSGCSKSIGLSFYLKHFHPEISTNPINKKISSCNCISILPNDVDAVIFTVGNSDVQLECNKQYKKKQFTKPVLYSWLEGDGRTSHVLGVSYDSKGCFECLFTDSEGNCVNNQANTTNDLDISILRNGCGGTRVAYGNTTLLTATAITLQALKKILGEKSTGNFIYNYENSQISEGSDFIKERCQCCGED